MPEEEEEEEKAAGLAARQEQPPPSEPLDNGKVFLPRHREEFPLHTPPSYSGDPWTALAFDPERRGGIKTMDAVAPTQLPLPKHILDVWVIVLIILATIIVMTSLLLCPATAVIIYRVRTHPIQNGAV
nr:PREDICTED: small integral membrane protein 3 [Anolis carolinensis]|eukprot:XP_008103020.1 PREDICTED: small integral membrane protein 3 [Anolis carolinensis]